MKKLSIMLLVLAFVFTAFAPTALAAKSEYDQVLDLVNKTNEKIEEMVDKAIEKADKETEKHLKELDKLEAKMESGAIDQHKYELKKAELADKYNRKIENIIDKLIDDTNRTAAKAIDKAAKKGFVVICEDVEVEIAGRTVLIDPLRIADF